MGLGLRSIKNVKGPLLDFLKFHSGTHLLFKKLGRHGNRGGSQECPNCGACRESVKHVLFESASYDSKRKKFLNYMYMKQILTLEALELSTTAAFSIKLCLV